MNSQNSIAQPKFAPINDLIAGIVVFLVALPLCLGIAIASGANPFFGVLSGIVGGIVVGSLSRSHTSVAGPAAGLTAVVIAQIAALGSYRAFLLAVVLAGVIQIGLGVARAGALSVFVPSSVIKGLLAAIGIILILKQIPHLLGDDKDAEGEMSFSQPDKENTFTEILSLFEGQIHQGAIVIGIVSLLILLMWDYIKPLKKSVIPAPLIVVVVGVLLNEIFIRWGEPWQVMQSHLVNVPIIGNGESSQKLTDVLMFPDWSAWIMPEIYVAAFTIAIVATLETLLNVEAVDRMDPYQRQTPPNRELVAQGVGNIAAGLIGGIPVTSVVVRSSVNINSGARTKASAIFHGILLAVSVAMFPQLLNKIPLAALAGILLHTGFKLASPTIFQNMWREGRYQFIPFLVTVLAIVFTDLLYGVVIGLAVSLAFILNSNLRRPVRTRIERQVGGEIKVIELANQVSFLNRAALERELYKAPAGTRLLIDATHTDYIDPDILSLIRDFKNNAADVHGVEVSFRGFRPKYDLPDDKNWMYHSTKELVQLLTPDDVLQLMKEGNERFITGERLSRDYEKLFDLASKGQHPFAVVLSCIDSRAPVETIFDLGLGDIFVIRVAGNVVSPKVLGSIEYSCAVAGAKLIVVLGHTQCGAVTSTVQLAAQAKSASDATGCQNLDSIVQEINHSVLLEDLSTFKQADEATRREIVERVSCRNVEHSVQQIAECSHVLRTLVAQGKIGIVGGIYNVSNGKVTFENLRCGYENTNSGSMAG